MKVKVTIMLSVLLLSNCAHPARNSSSASAVSSIPPVRYIPTSYTTEGGSYIVPCPDCGGSGTCTQTVTQTSYPTAADAFWKQLAGGSTTFLTRNKSRNRTQQVEVRCDRCAGSGYVQPH